MTTTSLRSSGNRSLYRTIIKRMQELPPHIFFIAMAVINIFPMFFIFMSSIKTNTAYFADPFGLPSAWNFESFEILFFERPFLRQLFNTIFLAGTTLIVSILVSVPAAYSFARLDFRGRETFFDFTTALMGVPLVVTIIPLFVLMSQLHLLNHYASAIIVYVGFTIPFSIYVLTSFFHSIPGALIDSAWVDGAGHLQIIRHVMVPLSKAPIMTLAVVNGLWVWNELLIALLFLQKETSTTMMASLARGTSRDVRNVPLIMAASAIASLPPILFLFFGQKYFIRGFLGGSQK